MTSSLRDEVVIVTGAGNGIGRSAALHLASCGAKVVVADRDGEAGERTHGEIAHAGRASRFVWVDVAEESSVEKMVEHALAAYGRLDGVQQCGHRAVPQAPARDRNRPLA